MLSNKEYEELVAQVVKKLRSKKNFNHKNIINDIKELEESSKLCNLKEKTYSSIMYQVRFLKSKYQDELKDIIATYQEIIFPDFSYKNDLNAMINGPYALKTWLLRYVCVSLIDFELSDLIKQDISSYSITRQYQEIDILLFKKITNIKVATQ